MVIFVGAGPGDVGLVTLKGKECIEKADVIIYAGSLVNDGLLSYAKESAKIYNSAYMTVDEVIKVMEEAERKGQDTVRLHTGDPSIYGAIAEQRALLDEKGIACRFIPGVSSLFAAAAALGIEYTLPEVSQSLIITRASGRTKVPEREALAKMAVHGCSMALFLSAALADQVEEELLGEGSAYTADTPVAIVYRASWEDEKIIKTRLGDLCETMEASGINSFALILVGDAMGEMKDGDLVRRSRLYAADFSTGFRKGNEDFNLSILSYTREGEALSKRLVDQIPSARSFVFGKDFHDSKKLLGDLFSDQKLIIIIGACGMAVRLIAPFLKSKATDPAVLCIDDTGRYVISLLSGHLGGANRWAKKIAKCIGAQPVITTATDNHNAFAVDDFAVDKHLVFADPSSIKEVSKRILNDEKVGYFSNCGIHVAKYLSDKKMFDMECRLYPKNLFVGMGCKRGAGVERLYGFLDEVFQKKDLPLQRIAGIFSIKDKQGEEGLIELAKRLGVEYLTFDAEELSEVEGDFLESDFVKKTVGVGNVCERACLLGAKRLMGAGETTSLLIRKIAREGMTIAVCEGEWPS